MSKVNDFRIYILLWAFYMLQGTLYESGGTLSQWLLVVILVISGYNVYYLNRFCKVSPYFKILNVFLVLVGIYGLIRFSSGEWDFGYRWTVKPYAFIKDYFISIMPIYTFYVYTIKGEITNKRLKFAYFLFWFVYILFYLRTQQEYIALINRVEVTNNSAYMFVSLLLLLPLLKLKPLWGYLLAFASCGVVLMSAKRGAILISIICAMLFVWYNIKNSSNQVKLFTIFGSLVTISIGLYFAIEYIESNAYLMARFTDTVAGDSSGRDVLYESLIKNMKSDDSMLHIIIGRGADSTVLIAGNFAHNDWLELATDMGLVGIVVYLAYWLHYYKTLKRVKRLPEYYYALLMAFSFCFLRTFFSMSINDMSTLTTLAIGYSMACTSNEYK